MAHIQVYTERRLLKRRKQYRWRIVARNGRIIATSSEGYYNLGDLWHALGEVSRVLNDARDKPVPVHDGVPARSTG